jgi:PAS domain S-box-containing protein
MTPSRLLIVEDESLVAADLEEQLTQFGYIVVGMADAATQAIDLARSLKPDLVLMDITLNGPTTGVEAAQAIVHEHNSPVIFLTAHTDETTIQRAKHTGPFGYLNKPFAKPELRAAIEIALHRHQSEQRVKKAERLLAATLRSIGDAVIATDATGKVTFMNPMAEALTGFDATDSVERDLASVFLTFDPDTRRPIESPVVAALRSGDTIKLERDKVLIALGGVHRPIDDSCAPIRDERGHIVGGILVFRDVSERKRQAEEREKLISDLQAALANVKTLSGLLPICAWCKKVRDDQGYWEIVESYISRYSETRFSHSICPGCLQKQKVSLNAD